MQQIKRNKYLINTISLSRLNQNNADLLLSVYELTARSSLQLAHKPRHQSHGRQHAQQDQCYSPDVNMVVSPKKIGNIVSP